MKTGVPSTKYSKHAKTEEIKTGGMLALRLIPKLTANASSFESIIWFVLPTVLPALILQHHFPAAQNDQNERGHREDDSRHEKTFD